MANRRSELRADLEAAREKTLWLLDQVPDEFLRRLVHSFYSPIGWHFGHIGRTEEHWVLGEALKRPCLSDELSFVFADLPENPKDNRVNIPGREGIRQYLAETRARTFEALDGADLASEDPFLADGYGWEFALQHECQHQETISEMMQLIQKHLPQDEPRAFPSWRPSISQELVPISGGEFCMGSDHRHGYDNEKPAHTVRVESFSLARHPVTAYQWSEFIEAGGYRLRKLWSDEGWAWSEAEGAEAPEYWHRCEGGWGFYAPLGLRPVHPDEPAGCLSCFEAEAYSRWKGLRLPTEPEWEYAAGGLEGRRFPWGEESPNRRTARFGLEGWAPGPVGQHPCGSSPFSIEDMAGGIWEWTADTFLPYPGFTAFPYDGYSKDHMKGEHRVCRGGSWATAAPILRRTFRNWYIPGYRQGLLGLRLAGE